MMDDDDLIIEFVEEAREHLGDVEMQLLQMEAMGADIDDDLVNTLFRAIHSVKGAAGFLGLTQINNVGHGLENVLGSVRDHKLVPDPYNVDVMLKAADRLRSMVESVEGSNDTDNSELCEKLDGLLRQSDAASSDVAAAKESEQPSAADRDDGSSESGPSSADEVCPVDDPTIERAENSLDAVESGLKQGDEELSVPVSEPAEAVDGQTSVESVSGPTPKSTENVSRESSGGGSPAASSTSESTIRVGVRVLDRLMNLAGELVLSRNQLLRAFSEDSNSTSLDAIASGLDQVTTELQETIMQTRMQPIGNVFNRFTRVVRDLSNKLGKQCDLQIDGRDVEVDKTIIEAISDPLTHLVRNSVDHGIETPGERTACGKPPVGTLHLRAFHQSGKMRIEIGDDGKGIDASVLKAKAVANGLLTKEQAQVMGDREAVRLIFHPGFSTAQAVTDVSGRGVGMDVVRSNIEKIGGTVDVETKIGVGTTIQVTLPLTLAIIPSLIVRSGDDRFALPQVNIAELVRIRAKEKLRIAKVNHKEVLRLRGSLLPLVRLQHALGRDGDRSECDSDQEVCHIIVVETGPLRYGLVVDHVFDSEEIVVKPLGRHLKDCPCLSGATLLGDGRVALILDVHGTAQQASLRAAADESARLEATEGAAAVSSSAQSLLLFRNHPSEQFAVPMECIARVERVRADQIEAVGDHELLRYREGTLPLIRLESVIQAKAGAYDDRLYVVVFEAAGREIGIIAPELVDIRDIPDLVDHSTFSDDAVIGSQVIEGNTTRLVDTVALARKARQDWFGRTQSGHQPDTSRFWLKEPPTSGWNQTELSADGLRPEVNAASRPKHLGTLLLAEDSSFFRRQVKGFLESSGCEVIDCEDGREAWETLNESPDEFDLVLTDIEMPNMDGLELTRRIRSENRFADLPIIALTSLAAQEDFQRGYDAGVTEYQVKLDREELVTTIIRHLNRAPGPQEGELATT